MNAMCVCDTVQTLAPFGAPDNLFEPHVDPQTGRSCDGFPGRGRPCETPLPPPRIARGRAAMVVAWQAEVDAGRVHIAAGGVPAAVDAVLAELGVVPGAGLR